MEHVNFEHNGRELTAEVEPRSLDDTGKNGNWVQ